MAIKVQTNFFAPLDKPKMYFVYMIYDKHISWDFSMRVLINQFHKTEQEAEKITEELLKNGEAMCGAYLFDVAESKAKLVEELAKKACMSLQCLVEEV